MIERQGVYCEGRRHVKKNASQENPWDYQQLKIDGRGKTIVFCLPGRGCSYTFLKNFLQLAFDLVQNGMSIQISQDYSSMVNFARCKCLGQMFSVDLIRFPGMVS